MPVLTAQAWLACWTDHPPSFLRGRQRPHSRLHHRPSPAGPPKKRATGQTALSLRALREDHQPPPSSAPAVTSPVQTPARAAARTCGTFHEMLGVQPSPLALPGETDSRGLSHPRLPSDGKGRSSKNPAGVKQPGRGCKPNATLLQEGVLSSWTEASHGM